MNYDHKALFQRAREIERDNPAIGVSEAYRRACVELARMAKATVPTKPAAPTRFTRQPRPLAVGDIGTVCKMGDEHPKPVRRLCVAFTELHGRRFPVWREIRTA